MKSLCFAYILALSALASVGVMSPASAQTAASPLILRSNTSSPEGQITLGDLFENAGAAASVVVGYLKGPSAVLDAGMVQGEAGKVGAFWDNPRGLHKIIVTQGAETRPAAQGPSLAQGQNTGQAVGQIQARSEPVAGSLAVRRNELVSVTWSANGLSLTMSGTAQKDGSVGDLIQIQNPSSKKMIDAVIIAPGRAVAGQAADQIRSQMLLSSR